MTEPTYEELKARVAELEKQAGRRQKGSLEVRVGEKGGVSVYGLGRFPVTLYYEQWIRLLHSAHWIGNHTPSSRALEHAGDFFGRLQTQSDVKPACYRCVQDDVLQDLLRREGVPGWFA